MKRFYLWGLLILALSACKRSSPAEPEPEFQPRETEDWTILTAPVDANVWGVYGNLDSALLICSSNNIYRTVDQGKSWQKSDFAFNSGIFGFVERADTLYALAASMSGPWKDVSYAGHAEYRSLDGGQTWTNGRSRLDYDSLRIPRNYVKASNGTAYEIDKVLTPTCPQCTVNASFYVDTPGFKTSTGRKVALPQEHQIESLYLDSKQRLYLVGSAALCGTHEKFSFCGGRRGVIYISKKALP